jgi:hypothetical protein
MAEIALEYMGRMGIRNTQFFIARHFDKEHPHILFRHAVMVKLESYIAVPHYRCRAPLLHLVAYGGKWAEVLGFNLFASGQGTSVHPAPVKG